MPLIETGALAKAYMAKGRDKLRISTIINELETMAKLFPVDPVHYAGGCYCRECENMDKNITAGDWCLEHRRPVSPLGYCSYGRRMEEEQP